MFFNFGRIQGSVLLIALAMGYIVCYLANKEQKLLRSLGNLIGLFIIVISSLLLMAKYLWILNFPW
ncbi:MAG: hypothetical protein NTW64_00725 [Candidatus Omnitrophica bacterium]|nr:hypothetical protein [Candidatus Omnitrophota bacterium]